jgi:C4-dicarboxylate transporter, DctM subunit
LTQSTKGKPRTGFATSLVIMNVVGSLLIVVITLLICSDIIGRSFFNTPVAGVAEVVSLAIVAIVFLQLGQAVYANALTRTDIFLSAIRKRKPKFGALLSTLFLLLAALLFLALLYGSWVKLIDAWSADEHVGVYGLFVAPVWPVRVIVVLGSAAAALQFALQGFREFQVGIMGASTPGDETI